MSTIMSAPNDPVNIFDLNGDVELGGHWPLGIFGRIGAAEKPGSSGNSNWRS